MNNKNHQEELLIIHADIDLTSKERIYENFVFFCNNVIVVWFIEVILNNLSNFEYLKKF